MQPHLRPARSFETRYEKVFIDEGSTQLIGSEKLVLVELH